MYEGLTLHDNQVYIHVCDAKNHRIQVFDLDLNFIRSIGSHGKGRGEFDEPYDVKFDSAGNMYVVECGNGRVQVMDINGRFIRAFGQEGKENWICATHQLSMFLTSMCMCMIVHIVL